MSIEQKVNEVISILKTVKPEHARFALEKKENVNDAVEFLLNKKESELEELVSVKPTGKKEKIKQICDVLQVNKKTAEKALEQNNNDPELAVNAILTGKVPKDEYEEEVITIPIVDPTIHNKQEKEGKKNNIPKTQVLLDDDDGFEEVLSFKKEIQPKEDIEIEIMNEKQTEVEILKPEDDIEIEIMNEKQPEVEIMKPENNIEIEIVNKNQPKVEILKQEDDIEFEIMNEKQPIEVEVMKKDGKQSDKKKDDIHFSFEDDLKQSDELVIEKVDNKKKKDTAFFEDEFEEVLSFNADKQKKDNTEIIWKDEEGLDIEDHPLKQVNEEIPKKVENLLEKAEKKQKKKIVLGEKQIPEFKREEISVDPRDYDFTFNEKGSLFIENDIQQEPVKKQKPMSNEEKVDFIKDLTMCNNKNRIRFLLIHYKGDVNEICEHILSKKTDPRRRPPERSLPLFRKNSREDDIRNLMDVSMYERKYCEVALEETGFDVDKAYTYLTTKSRMVLDGVIKLKDQKGIFLKKGRMKKKDRYIPPETWDKNPRIPIKKEEWEKLNPNIEPKTILDLCKDEIYTILLYCHKKETCDFLLSNKEIYKRMFYNNDYWKNIVFDKFYLCDQKTQSFMLYLRNSGKYDVQNEELKKENLYVEEFPKFKELFDITRGRRKYDEAPRQNQFLYFRTVLMIIFLIAVGIGFVIDSVLFPLVFDNIIPSTGFWWIFPASIIWILIIFYLFLFIFSVIDSNYFPIINFEQRKRTPKSFDGEVERDVIVDILYNFTWICYFLIVISIKICFLPNYRIFSFLFVPGYVLMFFTCFHIFIPYCMKEYSSLNTFCFLIVDFCILYVPLCIFIIFCGLRMDDFLPEWFLWSYIFIIFYIIIIIAVILLGILLVYFLHDQNCCYYFLPIVVSIFIGIVLIVSTILYALKFDEIVTWSFILSTLPVYVSYGLVFVFLCCAGICSYCYCS